VTEKILIITGQLINRDTRQGLLNLRIQAWDNTLTHNEPIADATADAKGRFEISLDLNQLVTIFGKRPPELFFKVYRENGLLASTENLVVWSIKKPRQEIVIELEELSLAARAVPPEEGYRITSRVIDRPSGQGVTDLRVEAWDDDPGTDDFLGQATTDDEGHFTITFTEADFNRRLLGSLAFPSFARLFEDRQPDLYFKIYNGETLLLSTRDSVRVNLSARETDVTLEIDAPPDKVAPPDSTAAEAPVVESELPPEWLTEIEPIPFTQEPLATTLPEEIELPDGVELIPIKQLPEPVAAPTLVTRSIAGQIHHQKTRQPLANFTIYAAELATRPVVTNAQGHFTLNYTIPEAEADQERLVQLTLANPDGQTVHQLEVTLPVAADEPLTIAVPLPLPPTTPDTTVDELAAQLQLELPDMLRRQLAEQNITTLATLLQVRHPSTGGEVAIAANGHTPLLQRLEAHANLSILPTDAETDATLINQGYDSITSIAQTPRETFMGATAGQIGNEQAGQIHAVAQAQTAFLNNVITGLRVSAANNPATAEDCPDCQTAVSPLAYLADLLDYGLKHIRHNGTSINLDFLQNNFHQLFGDLPTDCEAVDQQVRQIRLVVEVLRGYLRAHPPATSDALAIEEQRYRETAYRTLLTKIATSYEAIQEARLASEAERQALADSLGITPDHLRDLLLRSPSNRTDTGTLTEQNLERLFGLADTTRDPLSEGATLGTDQGRIKRWDLDGVAWRQNTDSNGRVYGQIEDGRLKLYQDRDRTDLVAEGPAIANQDNVISLINNSGLSARINLDSGDNGLFELAAVPEYLAWRLERLHQLWTALDWPPEDPFVIATGHPIIDPDRVGLIDLLGPHAPSSESPQVVLRNRRLLPGLQALYTFHEGSGDTVNDTSRVSDAPLNLVMADPTTIQWEAGAGLTLTVHNLLSTLEPATRIINACRESRAITLELWIKPAKLGQSGPARLMALADTPDRSNVMLGQGLWGRQPTDLYYARQHTTSTNFSDLAWPLSPQDPIEVELTHLVYTCTAPTQDSNSNPVPGQMKLYVNGAERTSVEFKGDFSHWDDGLHLALANERTGTRPWLGTFYLAAVYSQPLSPDEIKRNYLADCYSAGECAKGVALWQARRLWLERWQLDLNPATDVELIPEPEPKTDLPEPHDLSLVVQLWQERQRLLSDWQKEFKADPTVEKFEAVLETLLGVPLPIDEALAKAITGLGLSADCPAQLVELVDLIGAGPPPPPTCNDPTLPPDGTVPDLTETKWAELYAQIKKLAMLPQWVTEEQEQRLYLDDAYFFVALDRPKLDTCLASIANDRKTWETQLRRPPARPLIDPDVITEEHLKPNRNPAAVLRTERRNQLQNRYDQIDNQRKNLDETLIDIYVFDTILTEHLFTNIFSEFRTKLTELYRLDNLADYEILLEQTLACPIPILEALYKQLVPGNPARIQAIKYITTDLLLTVEQFEQLMAYRTSLMEGAPSSPPETYTVLARRVLVAYSIQLSRRKLAAGDPALTALGFNPEMLARLAELRGLLLGINNLPDEQDVLLEEDWADVYHILIQAASKQRRFNAWRKAEREQNIILSPLYFKLPDPLALIANETEEPSIWRAHWRLRRDWEDTLEGRLDLWDTAIIALQEAVAATEEATLSLLRAALLRAFGPTEAEAANWVTKNLLIEAQASPCQITTRISQAIETVQGLIWSARSGLLAQPLGLDLDRQAFDEDWRWLGSYATWRAAMLVFLYPENLLLPNLRPKQRQTPAFKQLVEDLSANRRLRPEQAQAAADKYAAYFRDVCSLEIEACATVPELRSFFCKDSKGGSTVYLFGRSTYTNKVYWSRGIPQKEFETPEGSNIPIEENIPLSEQTFWIEVNSLGQVKQLLGAVYYEPIQISGRFILLFAFARKDGQPQLLLSRYDITNEPDINAAESPIVLDLPFRAPNKAGDGSSTDPPGQNLPQENPTDNDLEATSEIAIRFGPYSPSMPPLLYIRLPDGTSFARRLNQAADNWAGDGDWKTDYDTNFAPSVWLKESSITLDALVNIGKIGDFDGDGQDEVAIAVQRPGREGAGFRVLKFDPKNKQWRPLSADQPDGIDFWAHDSSSYSFSALKAWIGDFDGDNRDEIAIALDIQINEEEEEAEKEKKQGWRNDLWILDFDPTKCRWSHLSPIPGHELGADLSFSKTVDPMNLETLVIGDFDQDGRDEIAVARNQSVKEDELSHNNDFWAQDLINIGTDNQRWVRMSSADWQSDEDNDYDFDASTSDLPAFFAVAGNFSDESSGEIRREQIAVITRIRNTDRLGQVTRISRFWIMEFENSTEKWIRRSEFDIEDDRVSSRFVKVGDFDGNRRSEIVIAPTGEDSEGNDFWVRRFNITKNEWENFSDIGRGKNADFDCTEEDIPAKAAVIGDFDKDGRDEIAIVADGLVHIATIAGINFSFPFFWVMDVDPDVTDNEKKWRHLSAWAQSFKEKPDLIMLNARLRSINHAGSGDFDRDGRDEILVGIEGSRTLYVMAYQILNSSSQHCPYINIKPDYSGPFDISPYKPLGNSGTANESNTIYFEEAWYFVPLQIALQIQQRQQYQAALDWYRLIYDYSGSRRLHYNPNPPTVDTRPNVRVRDWLKEDPLNPHNIIATRQDGYTLYTVLSIVRCLADFADAQFTRDTAETVAQARSLYQTALDLLRELETRNPFAGDVTVQHVGHSSNASSLLTEIAGSDGIMGGRSLAAALTAQAEQNTQAQNIILSQSLALSLLAQVGTIAAATPPTHLNWMVSGHPFSFCIPANPELQTLRRRATFNLYKLRNCRNIAGLERQLAPYAAPTSLASGFPLVARNNRIVSTEPTIFRPTPYHYPVLIERAKQLVQLAMQVEGAMLAALEKRDAEFYARLQARQGVELAEAGVRLQSLRLNEAQDSIRLAQLQRERAQIQQEHYQALLDEGLLAQEHAALGFMATSAAFYTAAAATQGLGTFLNTITFGIFGSGGGGNAFSSLAGTASSLAQLLSTQAGYERRQQDWQLQRNLARQEVRIGQQQILLAMDQVRVVEQEREMTELQRNNAQEIAEFLATKFTNTELYEWMSNILEGVYSFFLQQATAIAKLAEAQLAFERQEIPKSIIQADYWEVPVDGSLLGYSLSKDTQAVDRRGLTGSARLLQDIYQLDQYAFDTNQRKLQLSKTISLARLSPVEFARFRQSEEFLFSTPMELFDRDFPGHYLRLIKRVSVSVIALIPPNEGIRATLSNEGPARVVIGDFDIFEEKETRPDPQLIAFTSPQSATGLFELNPQSELLNPFEGLGVATSWRLSMPRASNQFDFQTIFDVLITVDYTALHSLDYQKQVLKKLGRSFGADQYFSFRYQFADQWFDLHNPDQTATPLRIRFDITRSDFPPNLDFLKTQQLILYFARRNGIPFVIDGLTVELAFKPAQQKDFVRPKSLLLPPDGTLSTRRGNANNWLKLLDQSPVGTWELLLPDKPEVRDLFKQEEIEDILFVITYSGETP
jgi:hypothetical protein